MIEWVEVSGVEDFRMRQRRRLRSVGAVGIMASQGMEGKQTNRIEEQVCL